MEKKRGALWQKRLIVYGFVAVLAFFFFSVTRVYEFEQIANTASVGENIVLEMRVSDDSRFHSVPVRAGRATDMERLADILSRYRYRRHAAMRLFEDDFDSSPHANIIIKDGDVPLYNILIRGERDMSIAAYRPTGQGSHRRFRIRPSDMDFAALSALYQSLAPVEQ